MLRCCLCHGWLIGYLGVRKVAESKNLGVIQWDLMAFCDVQSYYGFEFYPPLISGARAVFFGCL